MYRSCLQVMVATSYIQHLSVKKVNTEKIKANNALIQMGLERKKKEGGHKKNIKNLTNRPFDINYS